ncbi:MAG: hypothetical protein KBF56_11615 [Gemmatimonadaceae bacterium]|nr:hypothetical protein [Gemmatimonadaceae bacterium]
MSDVCRDGLSGAASGGVRAPDGSRSILFDADGTRQAVRQRALPEDDARPPLRRRAKAAEPGYRGRKRGEAVRSRMTVQQRHTGEWLGTFGAPGNGDAYAMLGCACDAVVAYLTAHALPLLHGVVRLDGEHGWAHHVDVIKARGLGYLLRVCDYQILHDPAVRDALAAGAIARLRHPDTGIERELFDLPAYAWSTLRSPTLTTRMLIARRREVPGEDVTIGKRLNGWVYELVATDRTAAQWDAARVYTLYQDRGAFEATLGQEDREVPTDRWVSFTDHGQEFWQILCQWVWNLRQRSAVRACAAPTTAEPLEPEATAIRGEPVVLPPPAREHAPRTGAETMEAAAPPPPDETTPVAPRDPLDPTRVAAAFGTGCFERRDAHTVVCPAGVVMHASERVVRATGPCVRYQAPPKVCRKCALSVACRGPEPEPRHGRRITLPVWPATGSPEGATVRSSRGRPLSAPRELPPAPTPASPTAWEPSWNPTPLTLESQPASALRRWLRDLLRGHRVELSPVLSALVAPRQQRPRSHRRRSWLQVWSQNARTQTTGVIKLAGIPGTLASVLGLPIESAR